MSHVQNHEVDNEGPKVVDEPKVVAPPPTREFKQVPLDDDGRWGKYQFLAYETILGRTGQIVDTSDFYNVERDLDKETRITPQKRYVEYLGQYGIYVADIPIFQ